MPSELVIPLNLATFVLVFAWLLSMFLWIYLLFKRLPDTEKRINDRVDEAPNLIITTFREGLSDPKSEIYQELDLILADMTSILLRKVTQQDDVKKFIGEYMNGISLAFVRIICNRFGINEDELKSLVQQAGGTVTQDGNIDFTALIQQKLIRQAPKLLDRAIDALIPPR